MKYLILLYENDTPKGIIDSRYYMEEPTEDEVQNLMVELKSPFCQVYYDKYDTEEYDELICEYTKD